MFLKNGLWISCMSHENGQLAELFNKCLKESCFPDCSKVTSVVRAFKNVVDRSTAKKYLHVCLISVVSKVFQQLVNNRIVDYPWLIIKMWPAYVYRYYFGRCSSQMAQLVPHPFSRDRSTRYFDRLHDYSVTIPRRYKDVSVNSLLPCTARLWNSLALEYFPFSYDLNGFKSRINKHLSTVGSF